jgi:DNA-binding response OmpR family regulator
MARKILLVEDDKGNESLKALLITNGYLVETTHKGSEALRLLKDKTDLVIADPTLSDMTGEVFVAQFVKNTVSSYCNGKRKVLWLRKQQD